MIKVTISANESLSAAAADKIASTLPFSVVILLSTDVEYVENPVVDVISIWD